MNFFSIAENDLPAALSATILSVIIAVCILFSILFIVGNWLIYKGVKRQSPIFIILGIIFTWFFWGIFAWLFFAYVISPKRK